MSTRNQAWAYQFRHIQPIEKFVLVTLGDRMGEATHLTGEYGVPPIENCLPNMEVSDLPNIAGDCNLPCEKVERIVEQLMRRGLVRTAPGLLIELCTFVNPLEWNQRKEKPKEIPGNGTGKKRKK